MAVCFHTRRCDLGFSGQNERSKEFHKSVDRTKRQQIKVSKVLLFQNLRQLPYLRTNNGLSLVLSGDFGGKKDDIIGVLDDGYL